MATTSALLLAGVTSAPFGIREAWALATILGIVAAMLTWFAASIVVRIERRRGLTAGFVPLVATMAWLTYAFVYWAAGSSASNWLPPLASAALISTGLILYHATAHRRGSHDLRRATLLLFSTLLLVQALFVVHLWFAEGPWYPTERAERPNVFWLAAVAAVVAGCARAAARRLALRLPAFDSPQAALLVGAQFLAAATGAAQGAEWAFLAAVLRALCTIVLLAWKNATLLKSREVPIVRVAEMGLVLEGLLTGTFLTLTVAMGV